MTIGVIPKTVIDSMEYLMNFHFVKDVGSKSRSKKRHSFKGKKTTEVRANHSVQIMFNPFLLFEFSSLNFSNACRNALCKDGALNSGRVKAQATRAEPRVHIGKQTNAEEKPWPGFFPQHPFVQDLHAFNR